MRLSLITLTLKFALTLTLTSNYPSTHTLTLTHSTPNTLTFLPLPLPFPLTPRTAVQSPSAAPSLGGPNAMLARIWRSLHAICVFDVAVHDMCVLHICV